MKAELNFPSFTGFYYSIWDEWFDSDWSNFVEDCQQRGMTHLEYDEDYRMDYTAKQMEIVNEYSHYMIKEYNSVLDLDMKLEGKAEMVSPRYYNYTTDKIYRVVDNINLDRIVELMIEHKDKLSKMIYDNHTSYDGFISFMDNTFNEWVEHIKNAENEKNELYLSCTLCYLYMIVANLDRNEIEYNAYEYVMDDIFGEWEPTSEEAKAEVKKVEMIEDLWGVGAYDSERFESMSVEEMEKYYKEQKALREYQLSFDF